MPSTNKPKGAIASRRKAQPSLPKIMKLKNGMTAIIANDSCHQAATVTVFFKVGSRDEPKDYHGLTHFIEHMFFKGTEKRPQARQISSDIDQYGATFNATTDYDTTFYYIKVNRDHFDKALELLSDMLFHSLFRDKDIKTESKVVLNELKLIRSSPDKHVDELLGKIHYKGTTLEHDVGGDDRIIKTATRNKFMDYIHRYYRPENVIISISGNLPNQKQLAKCIHHYFDFDFKYKKPSKRCFRNRVDYTKTFRGLQKQPRFIHKSFPTTDSTFIQLAFPAWPFNHPKNYAASVLHAVLGANMSSRLFLVVREQNGLAYTIKTSMEVFQDLGSFMIDYGTSTDPKKAQQSMDLVCQELTKLKKELVPAKELSKAKNYLIGADIKNREDSSYVAQINGYNWMYLKKHVPMAELHRKIKAVTAQEVKKVAQELFKLNCASLAVISPKKMTSRSIKLTL